jgi:hypothetical protein
MDVVKVRPRKQDQVSAGGTRVTANPDHRLAGGGNGDG